MNTVASTLILRAADTGRDIATPDRDAERYLIQNGYAVYVTRPLMRLTDKGRAYADRERQWIREAR